MRLRGRTRIVGGVLLAVAALLPSVRVRSAGPRVIQIIADKDNRFKVPGEKKPIITVHAKEVLRLHIVAHKGTEWDKDGTVHTLTITALKDQGWDLRLKEGAQDFTVVAPAEPGDYVVECTVKCGEGHEDMRMKLVVVP